MHGTARNEGTAKAHTMLTPTSDLHGHMAATSAEDGNAHEVVLMRKFVLDLL